MDGMVRDADERENFKEILALLDECESDSDDYRKDVSRPGRSPDIEQDRAEGAKRLFKDYFCADPTYPSHMFERRFRVSRFIFVDVCETLRNKLLFFSGKKMRRVKQVWPSIKNVLQPYGNLSTGRVQTMWTNMLGRAIVHRGTAGNNLRRV